MYWFTSAFGSFLRQSSWLLRVAILLTPHCLGCTVTIVPYAFSRTYALRSSMPM